METSQAYIMGIKEGRSFLKHNPDLTREEIEVCRDNAKNLAKKHSNDMKDIFKGEYAFWNNQLKD